MKMMGIKPYVLNMIWDVFYGNYVGVVDFVKYIQGKNINENIDFFFVLEK